MLPLNKCFSSNEVIKEVDAGDIKSDKANIFAVLFFYGCRTKTLGLICPFPLFVAQMVPHDFKFLWVFL